MAETLESLEDGVRQCARGDAIRRPRIDNFLPTLKPDEFFCFSSMEGGVRYPGYYALRIKPDVMSWQNVDGKLRRLNYTKQQGLYGGLVFLYDTNTGQLVAIMNDGYVQHMRVGATGGLGMKYLANPDSRVLGIIGSGGMARTFALAAKEVRPIERVQIYSPNRAHVDAYVAEMAPQLDCEVIAVDSAEAAARDADILSACTSAMEPVIDATLIRPGMHVTNVAVWEMSDDANAKVEVVGQLVDRKLIRVKDMVDDDFTLAMDNVMSYVGGQPDERAKIPPGRPRENWYPNAKTVLCCNYENDEPYRRSRPDEITTLANQSFGVLAGDAGSSAALQGIQFASTAGRLYENARRLGLGTELLP
jgi:hypothetical protein